MNKYGPRRDTPLPGDVQTLLHNVGLRSTRQRIALASLLLRTANRRFTTEILYDEAHQKHIKRGALFQGPPSATLSANSSRPAC